MAQSFTLDYLCSLALARNMFLLNTSYEGEDTFLEIIDNDGYRYNLRTSAFIYHIKNNSEIKRFSKGNPYTYFNISLWLKKNDYSIVISEDQDDQYEENKDIIFICNCDENSKFSARFPQIKRGRNCCPKCAIKRRSESRRTETSVVLEKLYNLNIRVLGNQVYVNNKTPVKVECMICGTTWDRVFGSKNNETSCPVCRKSHGERKIGEFLKKNNINFISQKRFKNCYRKMTLPFDFYLPDFNCCIEYYGEQHFYPVDFSHKKDDDLSNRNFHNVKDCDAIKQRFCYKEGIPLLIISYVDYNKIDEIVDNFLINIGGIKYENVYQCY